MNHTKGEYLVTCRQVLKTNAPPPPSNVQHKNHKPRYAGTKIDSKPGDHDGHGAIFIAKWFISLLIHWGTTKLDKLN